MAMTECPACGGILEHCMCGRINLTNETIVISDRDEVTRLRASLAAAEQRIAELESGIATIAFRAINTIKGRPRPMVAADHPEITPAEIIRWASELVEITVEHQALAADGTGGGDEGGER